MKLETLLALMLFGVLPRLAHAQEASAVSSAREAAKSGIADYYAGRYAEAQDKLARAFAVVPVPTLAVFHARALAKSGKLVEASEVYLAATRLQTGDGDAETQEQARRDAKLERAALLKRIPRLRITVVGAPAESTTVVVNGANVPAALFATGWMLNPATVDITATYQGQRFEGTEQLGEGDDKVVTVAFQIAPVSAPQPVIASSKPNQPIQDRGNVRSPSANYRLATWASLGVGAAGLALGCTTGIWAYVKKRDLDASSCKDSHCYGTAGDEVDRYNLLRGVSTAGFVVAAVGGATGALLYFNRPKPIGAQGVQLTGWVGVASAGLGGVFQ